MTETFEYRGHEVVIETDGDEPRLSIDGEPISVYRIGDAGYTSLTLPHGKFASVEELARATIDAAPAFSGRRDA